MIDQPYQFDFYDGGGLDVAVLGLAEADAEGNVNVSQFGPRLAGAGGFINISQSAKKVVFGGTFLPAPATSRSPTAACASAATAGIASSSPRSSTRTFAGAIALQQRPAGPLRHRTLRVRARAGGLELTEIAPGIDLERDILAHMGFAPAMVEGPVLMDARIFRADTMGLRKRPRPAAVRRALRLRRRPQRAVHLNFEHLEVEDAADGRCDPREGARDLRAARPPRPCGRQLRRLPHRPRRRGALCRDGDAKRSRATTNR